MRFNPFIRVGYIGVALLIFASIIMVISPPPSEEAGAHSSQIVTFEFVDSKPELQTFFRQLCEGDTPGLSADEHCDIRKKAINAINYIDFGMMIVYGLFLFYFAGCLGKITGDEVISRAKYLAPLAVIFDALENAQMLIMTRASFDYADHIFICLSLFTRLKWGLLAALIAIIGWGMRKMPKSKWLGYFLFIPAIAGLVAIITEGHIAIEVWTGFIFISFFLLIVYCFVYRTEKSIALGKDL